MHLQKCLLPLALLLTTSVDLPQPIGTFLFKVLFIRRRVLTITGNPAADEVIRSSWSASNIANRAAGADADEAIRSSWSERTITNRDAGADADNLIRNSWAAGQIAN